MINSANIAAQEICCDATSPYVTETVSFFLKSSYHAALPKGKVHVDFSVHVIKQPVQPMGIWRCRVNYWLAEVPKEVSFEDGFEFYKDGYRRALGYAEEFIKHKYNLHSVGKMPADETLMEKYKAMIEKKKAELPKID
jgi:hypothetical protein